jgi:tetratricopeptide (TPR) repeat protein
MEVEPQYGPPADNVTQELKRGNPGHWLTGKGSTPDAASYDGSYDPVAGAAWIREYAAGKNEFQQKWIESAHASLEAGEYALAVVATRLALEIPYQGGAFTFRSGAVEALGLDDPIDEIESGKLSRDEMEEKLHESLRLRFKADEMAFGLPYETKQDLEAVMSRSRGAIGGDSARLWSRVVDHFTASDESHAAGVASIELGRAHETEGSLDEALMAYQAAVGLLKRRSEEIDHRGQPVHDTAEMQELSRQASQPLMEIIGIYKGRGKLGAADKRIIKLAINDLLEVSGETQLMQDMHGGYINMFDPDMLDQGKVTDALFAGYSMLAASSRFKEKRICKRAMAIISDRRAMKRNLEIHPNWWDDGRTDEPLPWFAD